MPGTNKTIERNSYAAVERFDREFSSNLVVAPDTYLYLSQQVSIDKNDNTLHEAWTLCNATGENKSVLHPDQTIKRKPDTSVPRLGRPPIGFSEAKLLSKARFQEIERKFVERRRGKPRGATRLT